MLEKIISVINLDNKDLSTLSGNEMLESLIKLNGSDDFLFDSAEHHKFYGWL